MYDFKPSQCTEPDYTCFGVSAPGNHRGSIGSLDQNVGCLEEEYAMELDPSIKGDRCDFLVMAHLNKQLIEWDIRVKRDFNREFNMTYSPNRDEEAVDGFWINCFQKSTGDQTDHFVSTYFKVDDGSSIYYKDPQNTNSSYPQIMNNYTTSDYAHIYLTSSTSLFYLDESKGYTDLLNKTNYHRLEVDTHDGGFKVTMGPIMFFGSENRYPPENQDDNGNGTNNGETSGVDNNAVKIALIVFAILLIILIIIDIILLILLCQQDSDDDKSSREPIQE